MTQLDWLRAWVSLLLVALCLILLVAPGILAQSTVSVRTELVRLLPEPHADVVTSQAADWAQRVMPSDPVGSHPAGSLGDLQQHLSQWSYLVRLRAAMLWFIAPWFMVIGTAALLDGWIARRIRQATFRPSNALLHRLALISLKAAFLGLLSYVLMPLPWPSQLLPCLLFGMLLALRVLLAETQKRL
ncbi:hypothetical protein C7S18_18820 [Ahniella affigens]|uniref:DUF4400 domain-containing protein n=1 Tax=Ahniella affigens TaxID=2021234 RepID=A0A2P1PWD6_9GAMM|nr:DUF4400 domain-containing protein [Ahniella affigens]AVP99094.1 hypothetical protein C7S18_18820 [Ahniella affigens]